MLFSSQNDRFYNGCLPLRGESDSLCVLPDDGKFLQPAFSLCLTHWLIVAKHYPLQHGPSQQEDGAQVQCLQMELCQLATMLAVLQDEIVTSSVFCESDSLEGKSCGRSLEFGWEATS